MRGPTKEEEQMKILLAVRRFRYTRVPVITPGYPVSFPSNYWLGTEYLTLPEYDQYVSGNYMPPIEVLPA